MPEQIKERPILFSAPLVRALLDGRKTQTRRVVKDQPFQHADGNPLEWWIPISRKRSSWTSNARIKKVFEGKTLRDTSTEYLPLSEWLLPMCPYGKPGDRLWVREAWRAPKMLDAFSGKVIGEKALDAGYSTPWAPITFLADGRVVNGDLMRPGVGEFGMNFGRYRHARFMPRWASRITLEITDVRVQRLQDISDEDVLAEGVQLVRTNCTGECGADPCRMSHGLFIDLWDHINGEGAWDKNPWVWALTFKRLESDHA